MIVSLLRKKAIKMPRPTAASGTIKTSLVVSSLVVRNSSLDFGTPNDYRRTTNDYIFFFVIITAPKIATSNKSDAISKANVYSPILPASP